jgi:flavorubredoxin
VYWVGSTDSHDSFGSNPYLIVDANEAVVINSGSRADFSLVTMKVLQTGISPASITALVYQNYDPRLCGNIAHMEDLIDHPDLRVISAESNHLFIRHYCEHASLLGLDEIDHVFEFRSGRKLHFVDIPYAHSAGSFVAFDSLSGILFSGQSRRPALLMDLPAECSGCAIDRSGTCSLPSTVCPVLPLLEFHRTIMSSERALRYALEQISSIPFTMLAPQHGAIIHREADILLLFERLLALRAVGIDRAIGDRAFSDLGDTSALKERLARK